MTSSSSQAQARAEAQAISTKSLTRANLDRLPFTSNIDNFCQQDSNYERIILGHPTQAGKMFSGSRLPTDTASYSNAGYHNGGNVSQGNSGWQ